MKVSDFIVRHLARNGVKDIFLLSGGGMMHLLDSVGRSDEISYFCNLNEQATSICADAYAQYKNDLAVCMVTTGPGGTNAITGVTASFLDSEPVLVISGQVKTADLVGARGVRQIGPQEVNIIEMVRPITKYAVLITEKRDVMYHLDKAIYLATHGRRGPVWLDIPLDVQGGQIDEGDLRVFNPEAEGFTAPPAPDAAFVAAVGDALANSERPVLLLGHGVIAAKAEQAARDLAEKIGIPVLTTWRAKMVLPDDHDLNFGHPGSPGPRFSNFILQNADVAVFIGTRLNVGVTAFNDRNFAPRAKKFIIDLDLKEIEKLDMDFAGKAVCDAGDFIDSLYRQACKINVAIGSEWLDYCRTMRSKYPIASELQATAAGATNMYRFGDMLSVRARDDDVVVTASSGRSCGIMNLSFRRREGQTEIGSMALGSMGFAVPAAIGACIASGKSRTIVLEGDGSLQHNIQELSLIRTYGLPIKLFILNNGGYASIVTMQNNHFKGKLVACDQTTGVGLVSLDKLADLYGLRYHSIRNDNDVGIVLDAVMSDDVPVLCEVVADQGFDEIPKAVSKIASDGSITSSKLEDLFPFLPESETAEAMAISRKASE